MKILSLCSGYGGLDLALQSVLAGEIIAHCEFDKHASRVLEHHWPDVPNFGDITTVDWAEIEPVDWLTAGYPCQPFSLAGKRNGAEDSRHIWPHIAEAIRVVRPGNILLENVRGHLSLGFGDVLGSLADLGYDARWGLVRASDAGAAHQRARVFIVAADTRGFSGPGRRAFRDLGGPPSGRLGTEEERQRLWDATDDRGSIATDPGGVRLDRGGARSAGWEESARRSDAPAHASGERMEGRIPAARADAERKRTATVGRADLGPGPAGIDWGVYEPAIRRWEHVTGRCAPDPTEPGTRGGRRLAAPFVEWMMGLPAGHVTDVPGLSRTNQLKILGNGVVPQQACIALQLLGAIHE